MSLFSSLRDFAQSLAKDADTVFQQVTTHSQLERIAAAAVLIAYADGTCDQSEKDKTVAVIRAKLPHFEAQAISAAWKKAESLIDLGYDFGKPDLLKKISEAKGDEADLLVRVGVLIGGADGDFDDNEKKVVGEICKQVGLSPSDYGC